MSNAKFFGTWQLDEGVDKQDELDIKSDSSSIILTINEPVYENWAKSVFFNNDSIFGETNQGD